ncbi:MAG: HAD family hydrolase [Gammaproteobacteria bacterium]|nr:HAD family hydrolase [Gammaproteobacteria bacterium]
MNKLAVLFDLDGTLFDTMPDFVYIFNLMLEKRGRSNITDLDSFRVIISKGNAAMIENALGLNEQHPEFKTISDEFVKHYVEIRGRYSNLFVGFNKVFTELDNKHISWGIVTNRMEANIAPFLKNFDLHDRAHCLVGADTVGRGKPHPDSLLHAAKLLHVQPEHCFYVGDFSTDIIAAKAAGMKSVAVAWGYHGGLVDMQSWEPDYIIDTPEELLKIVKT